jgi:hypothetical protein
MAGTSFEQRRGTAAQWSLANPILLDGEFGVEKDTGRIKVGDGVNRWNALPVALRSDYLPILGKAADSEKLDGHDSTEFLLNTDAATTYLSKTDASTTYLRGDAPVSAATVNAPVKRDQFGNASFNELMVAGQTTASSAARKDYVDAVSTALTNATSSASATRKLGYYWGAVTAFPTTGVLAGDTCRRTDLGTNGSLWEYSGIAGLGSGGWVPQAAIVCTSITRPTSGLFPGLEIFETDTSFRWQLFSTTGPIWHPLTPGAVSAKMWKSDGAGTLLNNASARVNYNAYRALGGMTTTTVGGGAILLSLDGLYQVTNRGYITGSGTGNANCLLYRTRSAWADAFVINTAITKWSAGIDEAASYTQTLPLKAGDALWGSVSFGSNTATMAPYGSGEAQGMMIEAVWIAPLNGIGPI